VTDNTEDEVQLTPEQEQLVGELNQWLIPIGAHPLNLADSEVSFLDRLEGVKMVGLGEATHGTQEFFQMKHRIFQYLVEHYGHKVFAFEADFAESLYLNDYVLTGEGDLQTLMKRKMQFWTWRTVEVMKLLEWMKEYNDGKPEEEKIHYHGFDCQFIKFQPVLLQEYFQRHSPALWEAMSPVIDEIVSFSTINYENMTEETFNDLKSQLESLEDQVAADKELLTSNSSSKEYKISKQLLVTIRQAFIIKYTRNSGTGNINYRDMFMAENALWIADFFGEDTKITLWAHNGHVARDPDYGSSTAMGYHLNEAIGESYRVVGFGFSQGSFTAVEINFFGTYMGLVANKIRIEPLNGSINFLFHHASHPNFIFDLDAITPGCQWENWIAEERPFLMIGSMFNGNPKKYYRSVSVRQEYDWIIYFDNTRASTLLW
jgi:erythromycin esterase